jgi:D-glycero-D-manno-heptose 1,7-bisphosphate phosphatase
VRPAAFLDRDGTIIEHVHHLNEPGQVRLLPRAAEGIRVLQSMDYACVVVTNQSAVGRGLLTLARLDEIHAEMARQLWAEGVRVDGIYYCPVAPVSSDRSIVEHPDRKPAPGMLLRAAAEMLLDLPRSWMVGDLVSDMLAGRNADVRGTILVRTGQGESVPAGHPAVDFIADDLLAAAQLVARQTYRTIPQERPLHL